VEKEDFVKNGIEKPVKNPSRTNSTNILRPDFIIVSIRSTSMGY
jgi:hypothetical protein